VVSDYLKTEIEKHHLSQQQAAEVAAASSTAAASVVDAASRVEVADLVLRVHELEAASLLKGPVAAETQGEAKGRHGVAGGRRFVQGAGTRARMEARAHAPAVLSRLCALLDAALVDRLERHASATDRSLEALAGRVAAMEDAVAAPLKVSRTPTAKREGLKRAS